MNRHFTLAAPAIFALSSAQGAVTLQATVNYRDKIYNTVGFTGVQDKPIRYASYRVETTTGTLLAQGFTSGTVRSACL